MEAPHLRPASPDDATAYADCAHMAALEHLQDFLGWGARRTIQRVFRLPRNLNSYACTYAALTDDRIGGMLTGYTGHTQRDWQNRTDWLFIRYGLLGLIRALPTQIKLAAATRETERVPINAYYVAMLAVYPHARRRGVARSLLALAESDARAANCATLELDVDIRNAGAIAAYERYGFEISRSSPTARLRGETVGFHRMVKPLTDAAS